MFVNDEDEYGEEFYDLNFLESGTQTMNLPAGRYVLLWASEDCTWSITITQ